MFLGQRRQQQVVILQFDVKMYVNDNLFEQNPIFDKCFYEARQDIKKVIADVILLFGYTDFLHGRWETKGLSVPGLALCAILSDLAGKRRRYFRMVKKRLYGN